MTPKKSSRPQAFSQRAKYRPERNHDGDQDNQFQRDHPDVHAMQRRKTGHASSRIFCASRIINAADIDAAETTNSMPSRGVSDQIGRLVTASRTPV